MRQAGCSGTVANPLVEDSSHLTGICEHSMCDVRIDVARDGCWLEWLSSVGVGDAGVTPLSELPLSQARVRALPSPPDHPPPPVPEEKTCDGSTCSEASDESTDCVSEPSNDVHGSEIGEQAFDISTGIEIDFDSLVFDLSSDDISDSPSSIRTFPYNDAEENDPELQSLLELGIQRAPNGLARKPFEGTCGSTRLNSRARAWIPGPSAPGASMRWDSQMESKQSHAPMGIASGQMIDILVTMQAAMTSSEFALDSVILQRPQGWALTVYVNAANLVRKEQVVVLGKTALIQSSKRSRSIYLIGYRRQPFVDTPMGFRAILCELKNSSDACWDFIQNGFCCYGNGCKWQHPNQPVIDVLIKIKVPA